MLAVQPTLPSAIMNITSLYDNVSNVNVIYNDYITFISGVYESTTISVKSNYA